ncbi:maleylpyruvate isomerase family mycothiol-dependent enzyme [Pseudonocardia acaciae]|uniref:maleylpyruvate isomerase family mycothiol-dependent enzyme n=1 Tax=Pseudonocardia acaciae TaxID=551276 RepID=UPI00048FA44E|nr:maleylpyruvate isomerase family mycothiol-dependent enzyme [Pseudonocardia acaciae]
MHAVNLKRFARDERADLAELLATLSPEQWEAPSLCEGWRVRDVVAHMLSYDELDTRALVGRFVKGRFALNRTNAVGLAEYGTRDPDQLLTLLNDHLEPRGLTAALGGMVAMLDAMIHHQDIRRPLGLPRQIPPDRLAQGLRCAMIAPPIGAYWRTRGLRLIATDLDWSHGNGPEVRGPGEALLMAAAGRRGVVEELAGPGQATLAGRIGG